MLDISLVLAAVGIARGIWTTDFKSLLKISVIKPLKLFKIVLKIVITFFKFILFIWGCNKDNTDINMANMLASEQH